MTSNPEPADMRIDPPGRSFWRNLSFVWLVPILALVVSLGVAWRAYSDRGGLVQITFTNAAGVTPGETTIRFRDVVIGTVETVDFTDDLSRVIVSARIDQKVLPFLDAEAQFWIVTPQVTTRGISGLSTVLSGVHINAAWDGTSTGTRTQFVGLETPPLVQPGRAGTQITLRTTPGVGVAEGGPVLYRGIEVGQLEKPRLAVDGKTVLVDAFILAPHDARLNAASRFWDTSGFSVSFGAGGFALNVDSFSSLIAGGVAFDNIYDNAAAVDPTKVFDIFYEEADARASVFAPSMGELVTISVAFQESISGLAAGASVQLSGLNVGKVTAIAAQVVETADGPEVRLVANLGLDPQRLGLGPDADAAAVISFLERSVEDGLRARLATSGLFSSSLQVDLVVIPDAPAARMNATAEPFPILPSVESNLPDFTSTVEGVLERINRLPVEDTMNQAIQTMASIEALLSSEELRALPGEMTGLVSDVRSVVNDEATRALPDELLGAVTDLRAIVTDLRTQGSIDALTSALKRIDATMDNVATASEDFPKLMQDLRDLAAKANSLETDALVASATKMLDSIDALIGTDDARALPASLNGSLDEVRTILQTLREGGVVDNMNATMASARAAAGSVEEATKDLPALIERLDGVLGRTDSLIASYGTRSDFNAETLAMLREVRSAAKLVGQLARTIERNPNALILGR